MKKFLIIFLLVAIVFLPELGQLKTYAQTEGELPPASYPTSFAETPVSTPVEPVVADVKKPEVVQLSPEFLRAKDDVDQKLKSDHVENSFFVRFKTTTDNASAANITGAKTSDVLGFKQDASVKLIKTNTGNDLENKMIQYSLNPNVAEVLPNKKYTLAWTTLGSQTKPNDFIDSNHWYYLKSKLPETFKLQGCGTVNNALCGGSNSVIVAVLDTGLAFENYNATFRDPTVPSGPNPYTDYSLSFHKESQMTGINIWTNPGENNTGGDNDNNGFCDDLHGVDMIAFYDNFFFNTSSNADWLAKCNASVPWVQKEGHPNDDFGHGTFVSGIIASTVDDATPPSFPAGSGSSLGIANSIQLMPVKVADYNGAATTFTIWEGIRYAVDEGAKVISMSLADPTSDSFDSLTTDAMNYAQSHGVLVVIASGNTGAFSPPNNTVRSPAIYTKSYDNVMAIGAYDPTDSRSSYTSNGLYLDMVAAVGSGGSAGQATWHQTFTFSEFSPPNLDVRDFSTFATNFGIGTSFAAPQVAGAAALALSKNNQLTPGVLKNYLRLSSRDIDVPGQDNNTGFGALDIENLWRFTWYPWQQAGTTSQDVFSTSDTNRVYQATTLGGVVKTRCAQFTQDGLTWTPWDFSGPSNGRVFFKILGTRLYEAAVGTDGLVRTRSILTTLDCSNPAVNWTRWIVSGATTGDIFMEAANGKLYQSVVAGGYVWIRWTDGSVDGGGVPIWSTWVNDGLTNLFWAPLKALGNKVYQVRNQDGFVWTRWTDGTVVGGNIAWRSWVMSGGTPGKIYTETSSNRLYQAVVASGNVWTRSTDGTIAPSGDPVWSNWVFNGGTNGDIFMASNGSRFFQSVVVGSNVWTRSTTDGTNWTTWVFDGGTNIGKVFLNSFANKMYQSVVGTDLGVWTRFTTDGTNWSKWFPSNSASTDIYTVTFHNKIIQSIVKSGNVWTRYYQED